jgi:hypothetical protein
MHSENCQGETGEKVNCHWLLVIAAQVIHGHSKFIQLSLVIGYWALSERLEG